MDSSGLKGRGYPVTLTSGCLSAGESVGDGGGEKVLWLV